MGSRFRSAWKALQRRPAMIAYLMAGDPDVRATRDHALALAPAIDMLELGIPFSDPIADGPTIQRAGQRALQAGTTPDDVLRLVQDLRAASTPFGKPIALMAYYNTVFHPGVENFVRRAADAGVDGLIVPDLPMEEARLLKSACRQRGMDLILLASPATDDERLRAIASATSGFLYLVSMFGVTGARDSLPEYTLETVKRVKGVVGDRIPLAVGFGVSRPEHVTALAGAGADGVIVGSAIVQRIEDGFTPEKLAEWVAGLRASSGP